MADLKPVGPGLTFAFECPAGANVGLRPGDLFPPEKPVVVVVSVQGTSVVFGALQGGEVKFEFPCAPEMNVPVEFMQIAPPKDDLPKHSGPLGPEKLSFPLFFWILLVFLLLSLIMTWVFFHFRAKQRKKMTTLAKKKILTPAERYALYLNDVKKEGWLKLKDPESARLLFARGYEALRGFLESIYKLKSESQTTREFLQGFRASGKVAGLNDTQIELIAMLLETADKVRFAGENPPSKDREEFYRRLADIYEKLQPAVEPGGREGARKR